MVDNLNAPSAEDAGPAFGGKNETSVFYPDGLTRILGADGTVLNGYRASQATGLPMAGNTAADGSGSEKRALVGTDGHQIVDVSAALPVGSNVIGKTTIDQTTPGTTNRVQADLDKVAGSNIAVGHGAAAAAVRVELPTDGTGVVGLNAGTNLVGKVGIDQTTPGATNGVQVNAALPAGANIIGAVKTDQTTHGTTDLVAADITKINGAAVAVGHGVAATALRVELPTDGTGKVGLNAGSAIVGVVTTDQTTHGTTDLVAADLTKLAGTAIAVNSGNKDAGTQRVVLATDQPILTNGLSVSLPADAKNGALSSVKITLSGTPATVTTVNIPDSAQGFRIYPRTNTVRFAIGENPVGEVASSSTPVTSFGVGGLAQNQLHECRLLAAGTSRTLRILSDTASTICDVDFF